MHKNGEKFWVIQENLYNEQAYNILLEIMSRLSIPHEVVKVVPLDHYLIPEPDISGYDQIMVLGSTTLIGIAKERGWIAFLNEKTFDYRYDVLHLGNEMLNFDGYPCRFEDIYIDTPKFIRPCIDSKVFTGHVINPNELNFWKESVLGLTTGYCTLDKDTMIWVSEPKYIQREYRFFIIDKKIVTGSLYKIGTIIRYEECTEPDVINYVNEIINKFGDNQPERAYCIDIAMFNDEYKVLEINCINSAGFYACDISLLIQTMNDMNLY